MGHACTQSQIKSSFYLAQSRKFAIHLIQLDDEGALATTFSVPDDAVVDSEAIEDIFVQSLEKVIADHPDAAMCSVCRAADLENWRSAFSDLVASAYEESKQLGLIIKPIEPDDVPALVRMEFEIQIRKLYGEEPN